MDNIERLTQIIQEHEIRIAKLENQFVLKYSLKQPSPSKDYTGIKGGIQLLIENNFFAEPK